MLHTARRWPGTLRADGRAPTDCSTGRRVPARPCWQGAGAVREAGNRHQSWPCGGSCQFLSCLSPKVCNSPSKSLSDPVVLGFLLEITSAALSCCGSVCFGFSTHRGKAHYITADRSCEKVTALLTLLLFVHLNWSEKIQSIQHLVCT